MEKNAGWRARSIGRGCCGMGTDGFRCGSASANLVASRGVAGASLFPLSKPSWIIIRTVECHDKWRKTWRQWHLVKSGCRQFARKVCQKVRSWGVVAIYSATYSRSPSLTVRLMRRRRLRPRRGASLPTVWLLLSMEMVKERPAEMAGCLKHLYMGKRRAEMRAYMIRTVYMHVAAV